MSLRYESSRRDRVGTENVSIEVTSVVVKECGGLSTSENGEELVHRDCQGLCRVLSSDA